MAKAELCEFVHLSPLKRCIIVSFNVILVVVVWCWVSQHMSAQKNWVLTCYDIKVSINHNHLVDLGFHSITSKPVVKTN